MWKGILLICRMAQVQNRFTPGPKQSKQLHMRLSLRLSEGSNKQQTAHKVYALPPPHTLVCACLQLTRAASSRYCHDIVEFKRYLKT